MGESGGFNEEINLPGGSFSRLLLSADDIIERSSNFHNNNVFSNNHNNNNNINSSPSPLFSNNTPKMLCFGDFTSQTSSSSSFAMPNSSTLLHHNHNQKRRNGSGQESGLSAINVQKNVKKKNKQEMEPKTITTNLVRHAKGKRVKLGERINSLQQLVCPYGKTDTASVLHEAIGYIRFLQDQVKVLSSPYLQHLSRSSPLPSPQHPLSFTENRLPNSANTYDPTKGLRSRGLCLVPAKCIIDIADINGADFWSSATSLSTSLTTTSTVVASRNSS